MNEILKRGANDARFHAGIGHVGMSVLAFISGPHPCDMFEVFDARTMRKLVGPLGLREALAIPPPPHSAIGNVGRGNRVHVAIPLGDGWIWGTPIPEDGIHYTVTADRGHLGPI